MVEELASQPAERILDVGAGTGALLEDWRACFPAATFTGLDRSAGMLALAPDSMGRLLGDARRLPLRDASVDLVAFMFMLFHLPDPETALAEARRVLRSGGRVATVTWGRDLSSPAHAAWTACLDAHGAVAADAAAATRHEMVDEPGKVATLLRQAGFATVRAWQEERAEPIDAEFLIGLKTRMGGEKARFDSLSPEAREVCVAEARRALGRLEPASFQARCQIVYAMAS